INVKTGSMFGRVVQHRTADALVSFMNALARRYPKKKIFVVWANLNTRYDGKDKRCTKFNKRHGGRFRFIYTPIHASWMNQVEIRFSILERRITKYGDFASRDEQAERVQGFIRHWN
ncbi:MAG: IS630 family transposase, partial [Myxococcales bacterium]|nr:IS630 family transposase [Myxococcales bacterium]